MSRTRVRELGSGDAFSAVRFGLPLFSVFLRALMNAILLLLVSFHALPCRIRRVLVKSACCGLMFISAFFHVERMR